MTENQNEMRPKGYLVESTFCGTHFFKNMQDANRKVFALSGCSNVTVTPLYTRATSPAERQIDKCKCDFRTRTVGDGCRYCNPQHYIDILEEQTADDSRQIEAIRAALETLDTDLGKVESDDTRFTLLRFFKNDLKKILEEGNV